MLLILVIMVVAGIFVFSQVEVSLQEDNTPENGGFGLRSAEETNNGDEEIPDAPSPEPGPPPIMSFTVEHTSSGFVPDTLSINRGDIVTFTNKIPTKTWPASDVHPTHTIYPDSDIDKCGTEEEVTIFDACKGLEEGESYSFTFDEPGTWRYHDHLKPGRTGTIIVQ